MLDNSYIFSVCIPTYNRCDSLKRTIESIVSQDSFDKSIEIVIVDNASSDSTMEIAKEFTSAHDNIHYYRNIENIGADRNILKAATLGKGKYIKMLNDNKSFNEGTLGFLKTTFSDSISSVVFLKNRGSLKVRQMSTIDDFACEASYHLTWLGAIAYRKSVLDQIDLNSLDLDSYLIQTDLLFKILEISPIAQIVYGRILYEPVEPIRSGYNYFKVFCNNFIAILISLKNKGVLSSSTLLSIKRDLFRNLTVPAIYSLIFKRRKYDLESKDAFKYIYRNFNEGMILWLFPFWFIHHSRREFRRFLKSRVEILRREN